MHYCGESAPSGASGAALAQEWQGALIDLATIMT